MLIPEPNSYLSFVAGLFSGISGPHRSPLDRKTLCHSGKNPRKEEAPSPQLGEPLTGILLSTLSASGTIIHQHVLALPRHALRNPDAGLWQRFRLNWSGARARANLLK